MRMHLIAIRVLKWLGLGGLAVLLAASGAFGLAQTGWGKERLARLLAGALAGGEGSKAELGTVTGLVPFDFHLTRLALADAPGVWLVVENASLKWSAWPLLRGRVQVKQLTASRVELIRLPAPAEGRSAEGAPGLQLRLPPLEIEQLDIPRLELGSQVLGEGAAFRLSSRLAVAEAGGGGSAQIEVQRTDGPAAGVEIQAVLKGEQPLLSIDARLEEAAGGLLTRRIGSGGPLAVRLQGEGPLDAWQGDLDARVEPWGELQAEVRLASAGSTRRISVAGIARLNREALPREWQSWLQAETPFRVDLTLPPGGEVILENLTFGSRPARIEGSGSLDQKKERIEGSFALDLEESGPVRPWLPFDFSGGARLTGHILGPLLQPKLSLEVELEGPRAEPVAIMEKAAGRFQLELLEPWQGSFPGLRLKGTGRLTGVQTGGNEPFPEPDIAWEGEVEVPPADRLGIRHLGLSGLKDSLTLSGEVSLADSAVDLEVQLSVADLRAWQGVIGLSLPLGGTLKTSLRGRPAEGSIEGRPVGRVVLLAAPHPAAGPLVGLPLDLRGDLTLRDGVRLEIASFGVQAPVGKIEARGSVDFRQATMKGAWQVEVADIGLFAQALGSPLSGALRLDGEVSGPLAEPVFGVQASLQPAALGSLVLRRAAAALEAFGWPPRSRGSIDLEVLQGDRRLQGRAGYLLLDDRLELRAVDLEIPGGRLEGRADLRLSPFAANGDLKGVIRDLSWVSELVGTALEGRVALEAAFGYEEQRQHLNVHLKGPRLAAAAGSIGQWEARAELNRTDGGLRASAEISGREAESGPLRLSKVRLRSGTDGDDLDFNVELEGLLGQEFEILSRGRLRRSPQGEELLLEHLKGRFWGQPLSLTRVLSLKRAEESLTLEDLALELGAGRLTGSARFGAAQQALELNWENLGLEILGPKALAQVRGSASGRLVLTGSGAGTRGELALRIPDLNLPDATLQGLPPARLEASARLAPERLEADLALEGFGAAVLQGKLQLPASVSLNPVGWSLPAEGALSGQVQGTVDLKRAAAVAGLDDQIMAGEVQVDLRLGGTAGDPALIGSAFLEEGRYEHLGSGTVIEKIELRLVGDGRGLTVETARAEDGGTGTVSASGRLDFDSPKGPAIDLRIRLQEATLVRHDYVTATADGELWLRGTLKSPVLGGEVTVGPAEVQIPADLPPELTELEVVEVGSTGAGPKRRAAKPDDSREGSSGVTLALLVRSPGKVFVRGRGLDSEWEGRLRLGGTAAQPQLEGVLSAVRGHFNFLGRRFIIREGKISFDGRDPPEPRLELRAEAATGEMLFRVEASGLLQAPRIKLSSEPEVPSDEVVSHLLFGRGVESISPVQALQLAQALNSLAGGRGLDLIGRTRSLLGVDQLEIRQAEENEVTLSAGKYLTDRVYLEVERGTGVDSGKASVELELTPNISVETEVGSNAEGGVGLNWRWDY